MVRQPTAAGSVRPRLHQLRDISGHDTVGRRATRPAHVLGQRRRVTRTGDGRRLVGEDRRRLVPRLAQRKDLQLPRRTRPRRVLIQGEPRRKDLPARDLRVVPLGVADGLIGVGAVAQATDQQPVAPLDTGRVPPNPRVLCGRERGDVGVNRDRVDHLGVGHHLRGRGQRQLMLHCVLVRAGLFDGRLHRHELHRITKHVTTAVPGQQGRRLARPASAVSEVQTTLPGFLQAAALGPNLYRELRRDRVSRGNADSTRHTKRGGRHHKIDAVTHRVRRRRALHHRRRQLRRPRPHRRSSTRQLHPGELPTAATSDDNRGGRGAWHPRRAGPLNEGVVDVHPPTIVGLHPYRRGMGLLSQRSVRVDPHPHRTRPLRQVLDRHT